MKEIVSMIQQLHKEYADKELEVKKLVNEEPHINCIILGELCDRMIFIVKTVLILDELRDKIIDNSIPQCN